MNTAAVRAQVEAALGPAFPAPFTFRARYETETISAGIPEVDALTGGLPRGGLIEICGPASSGRTSLLIATLAEITRQEEVAALVDANDAFDPHSALAAGVALERLLWVRCHRPRQVEQALKAADLLVQGGGFGLVAVDLGDVPVSIARRVPLASWFRFRRAVENTPTVLLVLEQEPYAKTCASLVLQLEVDLPRWSSATAKESRNSKLETRNSSDRDGRFLCWRVDPSRSRSGAEPHRGAHCAPHAHLLHGARSNVEIVRSRLERIKAIRTSFEMGTPWRF